MTRCPERWSEVEPITTYRLVAVSPWSRTIGVPSPSSTIFSCTLRETSCPPTLTRGWRTEMVDAVSILSPEEVVRLIFEARASGDVRRVLALMDPEVRAAMGPTEDVVMEGVAAVRAYLARETAEGVR